MITEGVRPLLEYLCYRTISCVLVHGVSSCDLDCCNIPLRLEMYGNGINQRCGNTASRSQSTTRTGLQMHSDTMFDNTGIPTEDEHI